MEDGIKALEQYYTFQKREWIVIRIFWFLMALILIAGLAGFFGEGALSEKTIASDTFEIRYNKFLRIEKETTLTVVFTDSTVSSPIGIQNDYLKKIKISQVTPEPRSVALKDDFLVYTFGGNYKGTVVFYLSARKPGSQKMKIRVGEKEFTLNQFIYF